jgi:hypothetical protein
MHLFEHLSISCFEFFNNELVVAGSVEPLLCVVPSVDEMGAAIRLLRYLRMACVPFWTTSRLSARKGLPSNEMLFKVDMFPISQGRLEMSLLVTSNRSKATSRVISTGILQTKQTENVLTTIKSWLNRIIMTMQVI